MNTFSLYIPFFNHIGAYFIIALLTTTSPSYCFLSKLDQWKRGNQTIYCFSNTDVSTKYSQKQLYELAHYAKTHNAHIITEDIADYTGKNQYTNDYIEQMKTSTKGIKFLIGSKEYLHKQGITEEQITNIEYRYNAHAALDGNVSLKTNDVMEPAYNEYNKGWKYSDEEAFNEFYKDKLQEYRQHLLKPCRSLFFYMYWRKGKPLEQVLTNAHYYKTLDSVVSLLNGNLQQLNEQDKLRFIIKNHGNPLICVKIARAIAQRDDNIILVCAKKDHIKEINNLLANANYTHVRSKTGSVRIGPKDSGLPRALRLHRLFKKKSLPNNKRAIKPSLIQCNNSKTLTTKKTIKEDENKTIAIIFLILSLFILIVKKK